jgi:hypothetical protein
MQCAATIEVIVMMIDSVAELSTAMDLFITVSIADTQLVGNLAEELAKS